VLPKALLGSRLGHVVCESRRRCPRTVVHTQHGIGIRYDQLRLQAVRVPVEHTEDGSKVTDVAIRGVRIAKPVPDFIEGVR